MKERPVLFSAPMIKALLAGVKSQTRRPLRVQPGPSCCIEEGMEGEAPFVYSQLYGDGPGHDVHEHRSPCVCPYGQPGDRLWVREAHSFDCDRHWIMYRADGRAERRSGGELFDACDAAELNPSPKWRPSIHLPRWASRITLEVTEVRVERLQAISDADARAEGCPCYVCGRLMDGQSEADCHCFHRQATASDYRYLWEAINGAGSWDANPWVWCVSFKRVSDAP